MPVRIVVTHDDQNFLDRVACPLTEAGYDVATYTDSMKTLDPIDAAEPIDVLITRIAFPPGQPRRRLRPHGAAETAGTEDHIDRPGREGQAYRGARRVPATPREPARSAARHRDRLEQNA